MNKSILGTILGTALLSLAKKGSSSIYGDIDTQKALKVKAKITFVPSAVDQNRLPMLYGTPADYLVFLDWYEDINLVAQKMREFNQKSPQQIQGEYWNEYWEQWDEDGLIDEFNLPEAVIRDDIMEPAYLGTYILPSWIEFVQTPQIIGESEIREGAAELYLDSGDADEEDYEYLDYDFIPEKYIKQAFISWTTGEEYIELVFHFPINERTLDADIEDFKTSIKRVVDAISDYHANEVRLMHKQIDVASILDIQNIEIVSHDPELPLSSIFQSKIRRH